GEAALLAARRVEAKAQRARERALEIAARHACRPVALAAEVAIDGVAVEERPVGVDDVAVAFGLEDLHRYSQRSLPLDDAGFAQGGDLALGIAELGEDCCAVLAER